MKRPLEDDSGDPVLGVGAHTRWVYYAEASLFPSSSLQWVELYPSKIHVKVLTSECKLNWEECHCICNSLRQGLTEFPSGSSPSKDPMSYLLKLPPSQSPCYFKSCKGVHSQHLDSRGENLSTYSCPTWFCSSIRFVTHMGREVSKRQSKRGCHSFSQVLYKIVSYLHKQYKKYSDEPIDTLYLCPIVVILIHL